MAKRIGEVFQRKRDEFVIEWEIRYFFAFSVKVDEVYCSPSFTFANACWYLDLWPNGAVTDTSEGYISLYLHRETSGLPISLECTLGLKTLKGDIDPVRNFAYAYNKSGGYGFSKLLSRSELFKRKFKLDAHEALTVVCALKNPTQFQAADLEKTETTTCTYCKSTLDADEDITSHLQNCAEFPIQCPKCDDVVLLRSCFDHRCQATGAEGLVKAETTKCTYCKATLNADEDITFHLRNCTEFPIKCPRCDDVVPLKSCFDRRSETTGAEVNEKLLNDFKSMMLSGDHSDAIIRVQGKELKLHRSVLASRSPYFHSMFNCSMKEKNTGVVTIDDCDPDVFRSFVHFLYTGKVDKLTVENVCDLYELSDKYQEDQLKSECLDFMTSTLSVENFCDFTILAFRHDVKELLYDAINFFASDMKEIIRSVKWQTLLAKYPTQANELFIKALN